MIKKVLRESSARVIVGNLTVWSLWCLDGRILMLIALPVYLCGLLRLLGVATDCMAPSEIVMVFHYRICQKIQWETQTFWYIQTVLYTVHYLNWSNCRCRTSCRKLNSSSSAERPLYRSDPLWLYNIEQPTDRLYRKRKGNDSTYLIRNILLGRNF